MSTPRRDDGHLRAQPAPGPPPAPPGAAHAATPRRTGAATTVAAACAAVLLALTTAVSYLVPGVALSQWSLSTWLVLGVDVLTCLLAIAGGAVALTRRAVGAVLLVVGGGVSFVSWSIGAAQLVVGSGVGVFADLHLPFLLTPVAALAVVVLAIVPPTIRYVRSRRPHPRSATPARGESVRRAAT